MRAPVLIVAAAASTRAIRAALADEFALAVANDLPEGRALASTGGFLAILAVEPWAAAIPGATAIDPSAAPSALTALVRRTIALTATAQRTIARDDRVGEVLYDEYIEHARYAMTRRYLMALLSLHRGSVTDAAKGAHVKRESLHRLMRRHHLSADDFRDR